MQRFNDDITKNIVAFPKLAKSSRYLNLVKELQENTVTLTNQGRYQDAGEVLANATTKIEKWMADELNHFEQLISEASVAWQNKALTRLASIIIEASSVYTGNPEPFEYYTALSADWPTISTALQRANTARIENRLDAEQDALREVARLNHDITDLNDRVQSIGQRLHQ